MSIKSHVFEMASMVALAGILPSSPVAQYVRDEPKVGRNEPCACGSGKKNKKCCNKI